MQVYDKSLVSCQSTLWLELHSLSTLPRVPRERGPKGGGLWKDTPPSFQLIGVCVFHAGEARWSTAGGNLSLFASLGILGAAPPSDPEFKRRKEQRRGNVA
jgi:hypothetical protein